MNLEYLRRAAHAAHEAQEEVNRIMPAKGKLSPVAGKPRHYTQAACILCGGDAKRYGRATGMRYGERYICEKCSEHHTFNRAGEIVERDTRPLPSAETLMPFYEALIYRLLAYADDEIVVKERDKVYAWLKSIPRGEELIENWYSQKS